MESEPGRDGVEPAGANAEHRSPPGMCGTGAEGASGVCQDAAAGPGRVLARVAEPGAPERSRPACRRRPFVRQFAGPSATLRGFAVDTSGRALLAGSFEGQLALDGTRLESAGASDAFVARLDPCGDLLWARRFGDAEAQRAIDVVAAGGNAALVLGAFEGTLDLGVRRLTAASSWGSDLFVAKLGPNGAARWAVQISGEEDAILGGTALAAAGDGGVLVLGKLEGAARVDGVRIARHGLGTFVVRLDASGRFAWVSLPPSGSDTEEIGIEVDDRGRAVLAAQDARGSATFVTRLDEDGEVLWHRRFRGSSDQLEMAYDIAVAPDGAALLSGSGVFGVPDLPGGPRPFLAKIDESGEVLWVKRFDAQSPRQVTASEASVILAGDALCDGGDPGSCSAWTSGLSEDGDEQWTRRLGADVQIVGLELDPRGQPMLAGSFRGTMALGSESFSSDRGALFVSRVAAPD
ncbi:hypothetical protein WMF18_06345 [Sorangium sp. So ce315]|uniref:hypothetical protein n=1 Tax=Sorangium sp. So ce315 TaxID=3133299 RepID=UPI003F5E45B5